MIIDIHTHYGIVPGKYNMSVEMQLAAMEKYHIHYALISNIVASIEHKGISANAKMLEIVREHKDRLGCMLWANEKLDEAEKKSFEDMYLTNRDIVKGIKIHPDVSEKRADDVCFDFFYSMAAKYHLPILLHTKKNQFSSVEIVVNAAKKHPNTIFILGHMEISSNGKNALEAVKKYDNIYGDTAWVRLEVAEEAEKMGIVHKMMFGTDSPISGADCYADDYYMEYYRTDKQYIEDIFYKNAQRVFGL
ncbi:MAG: amidohydrolase family protein [Tyzzerella sp.]|nr:amidohydrolase family protein [Tyzzerella sp.]